MSPGGSSASHRHAGANEALWNGRRRSAPTTLLVLAAGDTPGARANARGKLFEEVMAALLRQMGYGIGKVTRRNYAGMEIDIEGTQRAVGAPMYAECKCWDRPVDAPALQAFFGKYMAKWLQNNKAQGLVVAIPGLNAPALAFYNEYVSSNDSLSVRLLETDVVLDELQATGIVSTPRLQSSLAERGYGEGDSYVLCTGRGSFCVQLLVPPGSGSPSEAILYGRDGQVIGDTSTVSYVRELWPDLADFRILQPELDQPPFPSVSTTGKQDVVEVRGGTSCFEYQFPAPPEHFVGRAGDLDAVVKCVEAVKSKTTSARTLLVQASSGWGKSSLVLAAASRLQEQGHVALVVDTRTATSTQYLIALAEFVMQKTRAARGIPDPLPSVTGYNGVSEVFVELGNALEREGRVLCVMLDQFESVFYVPELLSRIKALALRLQDAATNVVLGFCWKTDVVGQTAHFPYRDRDAIAERSVTVDLRRFSQDETEVMLDKLAHELHARLRRDLRYFLGEFSQGYPWLLKKLCAHVKTQRAAGVPQLDIAGGLLNVDQLFREDIQVLSHEQEDVLRQVARVAPVTLREMADQGCNTEVVQSLVDRRLLIRIGPRYDLYWDIFKDYVLTGRTTVQENYLVRTPIASALRAVKVLAAAGGSLPAVTLRHDLGVAEGSFVNLVRDLRLLRLVDGATGEVQLRVPYPTPVSGGEAFSTHLRDVLRQNRLAKIVVARLEEQSRATTAEMATMLREACPYTSASQGSWEIYARTLAGWLDAADLAIKTRDGLVPYDSSTGLRDKRFSATARRRGRTTPRVQYSAIDKVAGRLKAGMEVGGQLDLEGIPKSTLSKVLWTMQDLGFLRRAKDGLTFTESGAEFVRVPEKRRELFAVAALRMPEFAKFLEVLHKHESTGAPLDLLAQDLIAALNTAWKLGTAKSVAKVLLNWARHTGLAPRAFTRPYVVPCSNGLTENRQRGLFPMTTDKDKAP